VSVMIAFGGKRLKGAWKEKYAFMPVFGAAVVFVMVCGRCEDRRERYVRQNVVKKKATAMTTLGGRMV
jgi:hypothetical protein